MSTYLITGIAGFIGSSLARALLQQGHRVRGIDNFSTGKQENISEIVDQIDFREADVLDFEAVRWACRDVDYVLHEAAIPSVPRSIYNPLETNRANVDGTPQRVGCSTRCEGLACHLCVVVVGLWRYTDAAEKRGHGSQRNLSVRRLKTCRRVLHDFLLALLRSGDGLPAILQHFWATTGPTLAVFRCAREIHHPNAGWRTASNFW